MVLIVIYALHVQHVQELSVASPKSRPVVWMDLYTLSIANIFKHQKLVVFNFQPNHTCYMLRGTMILAIPWRQGAAVGEGQTKREICQLFFGGQKGISTPRGWHQHTEWFHPPGLRISPNMERETEDFETERWPFPNWVCCGPCWLFGPGLCEDVGLIHRLERWKLLFSPSAHGSCYFRMFIPLFRLMYYGFRPICRCDLRQAPMIDTCCMVLLRSRVATLGAMYCVRHTCWQSRTLILKI